MELDYLKSEDLDTNIQNALEHYGVKGMKWGLRQYQNPDGTYTELGKKRRRVGYEKAEKEDEKNSKNEKDLSDEKIGGKAYKDMTRKELKEARKRARHNEKERVEKRIWNREKGEAIERGDLKFLTKYAEKLTDDEIERAIDRYSRIKTMQDISDRDTREKNDKYFNKAMNILSKTSDVSDKVKKIYTNVKDMETKHYTTDQERLKAVRAKKDMEDIERKYKDDRADMLYKRRKDEEKEKYDRRLAAEKLEYDRNKEREQREYDRAEAERKIRRETAKTRFDQEKDIADTKYNRQVAEEKKEYDRRVAEEKEKYTRDTAEEKKEYDRQVAKDKWEWEKANPNKNQKMSKDDIKNILEQLKQDGYIFTGSNKKNSDRMFASLFSKFANKSNSEIEKIEKTSFKDLEKLNKKYLENMSKYGNAYNHSDKSNPKSIHDVLPITKERDNRWKKDLKTGNSYKLDHWVDEMKRKYMKERNIDSATAKEMAEEYVDAWIDFYGKQRKK